MSLLDDIRFSYCKSASLPLDPNVKLNASNGKLLEDTGQYRSLIGRLLYLTISRLDICFAVNKLSQYVSALRTTHLDTVHHVLRYLKAALGQGLLFSSLSSLTVKAYDDANWGSCAKTRMSTTSYCVFLGDSLFCWKYKIQDIVSRDLLQKQNIAL
ncbi:uncharacterized protein LOC110266971 [Arachis ipaensis]|uniref:uncharacterized protein LOC110266971 n=1 Tax=Arachis ipaensis TaxID=130454 RepID=UPI000A2B70F4|nr:uncharacterized protein LOC110266971 [Arachis ipaensis]XP_025679129.1 uncharacterized protein LOC112779086 [Arachis hypogaea]